MGTFSPRLIFYCNRGWVAINTLGYVLKYVFLYLNNVKGLVKVKDRLNDNMLARAIIVSSLTERHPENHLSEFNMRATPPS